MASIAIFFRNGDVLQLGSAIEPANEAYHRIITSDGDFVDLSSILGLPRFGIRCDDVVHVAVFPADTTTTYYHSAFMRTQAEGLLWQQRMKDVAPAPGWTPPTPPSGPTSASAEQEGQRDQSSGAAPS